MKEKGRALGRGLLQLLGLPVRLLLQLTVLLAFRPSLRWASAAAKREAFRRPGVVICNHVRGWDAACLIALQPFRRFTCLVAKDMLDGSPGLRLFMAFVPHIAIDRRHAAMGWLRESERAIRQGRSVVLFPEGRCNFAKAVRPFRPGFAILAARTGAPVTPVYHNGEYHPFHGRRFRLIVGEPERVTPAPEGLRADALREAAERFHGRVTGLERQLNGFVRLPEPEEPGPSA